MKYVSSIASDEYVYIHKEPNSSDGDEAEYDDEGNVSPGVAGLADTKESVALGTEVGELSEARETADLSDMCDNLRTGILILCHYQKAGQPGSKEAAAAGEHPSLRTDAALHPAGDGPVTVSTI